MTWPGECNDTVLKNTRNVIEWAERRKLRNDGVDFTKPWTWQGYRGLKCGQVEVGERFDSTIVRLSGKAAHDWLADKLPIGHNVTRLDIAYTVWGVSEQSPQIALHSVETEQYRKSLQFRPYKVRLIDGKGDGDTLYIGSRSSEIWVRIYDKERSPNTTPDYKEALRYEIELKSEAATQAVDRITRNGYSAASCLAVLAGVLDRRGVVPLGTRDLQRPVFPPSSLPVSSLESTLSWLSVQVKPTVMRLMREGYELEVLEAMGLERYFNQGFRSED